MTKMPSGNATGLNGSSHARSMSEMRQHRVLSFAFPERRHLGDICPRDSCWVVLHRPIERATWYLNLKRVKVCGFFYCKIATVISLFVYSPPKFDSLLLELYADFNSNNERNLS